MNDTTSTFQLHQLEPRARRTAIDEVRDSEGYLHHEWWDAIYDDFARIADILGFKIGYRYKSHQLAICFQLNHSQGDYASFDASYQYSPQASSAIRQYCNDEELWRIADELTAMQVHQRLHGLEFFRAIVEGRDSRRAPRVEIPDWGIDEVGEPDENRFTKVVVDLNDWLYSALDKEYWWLTEDEQVISHIEANGYEFDEDGHTI